MRVAVERKPRRAVPWILHLSKYFQENLNFFTKSLRDTLVCWKKSEINFFRPLSMKQASSFKDHRKGLLWVSPRKGSLCWAISETANVVETYRGTWCCYNSLFCWKGEKREGWKNRESMEPRIRPFSTSYNLSPKLQRQWWHWSHSQE